MKLAIAIAAGFAAASGPATPAEDPPPADLHVALSAGVGFAYDLAGIRLEVRGERFGLYLGSGFLGFTGNQSPNASSVGACAGLHFFFSGAGEGVLLSLNGTVASFTTHYDPDVQLSALQHGSLYTLTATVGYRWRSGHVFFDAAAGGGALWYSEPPSGATGSPPPGVGNRNTTSVIPDAELGIGFEF